MNERDVFINCPFSNDYTQFFHALVYTVVRSGFTPLVARLKAMMRAKSGTKKSAISFAIADWAFTIFQ